MLSSGSTEIWFQPELPGLYILSFLPFCQDDDIAIGSFDLRSSSDDELSASFKNCIPMPDCPTEGGNLIDLRSVQPGVNCKMNTLESFEYFDAK